MRLQVCGHVVRDPMPVWRQYAGITRARFVSMILVILETRQPVDDPELHQLDGARYLRDTQHADAMLCRLVAHHSCAIIEADERRLADVLSLEFEPAPDVLSSVLTCCDMTTSPDGELVPVEQRLAEIHDRYGSGHMVSRSIQRATPMILRAVEQVHRRTAQTTQLRGSEAD
jgi:hypothetical protein